MWATATEDMDSLTLGTPILIRHLTYSEARKMPIKEIYLLFNIKSALTLYLTARTNHERMLAGLKLTNEQFIDLCILLGCDYCETIRGIGQKKSFELIHKYKNIEEIIKHLDKSKYQVPENWPIEAVRDLFNNPEVTDPATIEVRTDSVVHALLTQLAVQMD